MIVYDFTLRTSKNNFTASKLSSATVGNTSSVSLHLWKLLICYGLKIFFSILLIFTLFLLFLSGSYDEESNDPKFENTGFLIVPKYERISMNKEANEYNGRSCGFRIYKQ